MRSLVCTGIAAATLCAAAPKPAEAWGGGFLFGTTVGLAAGAVVGSTLVRPYPYPYVVAPPPYAYPPPPGYPLAYGYPPPYAYPPFYGNGTPLPGPSAATGYPVPSYRGGWGYASATQARVPPPSPPSCRPGQFFNTLTGNCDIR